MGRKPRSYSDAPYYHLMVQGINREYIFKEEHFKRMYLRVLKKYVIENNISLVAYCIMGNHAHILVKSDHNTQISKTMKQINTTFAFHYNQELNRVGYVFRDRFKAEEIYEHYYLHNCIKYIHMNPVKAKICLKQKDYFFSSYNDYLRKCGVLTKELYEEIFFNETEYDDILKERQVENNFLDEEMEIHEIKNWLNEYMFKYNLTKEILKNNQGLLEQIVIKMKQECRAKNCDIANIFEITNSRITRILKDKNNN